MLAKVYSAAVWGVDAYAVEVEVNAAPGKVVTVVEGLPDTAVKESRDRVITAVRNSAFKFPYGRVVFNLAPADVKKEGPSFDLPMALGVIAASDQLSGDPIRTFRPKVAFVRAAFRGHLTKVLSGMNDRMHTIITGSASYCPPSPPRQTSLA